MMYGPGTASVTPSVVSPPRVPTNIDIVRRQFGRRAVRLAGRDVLLREVAARMLERLSYIRLAPRRILDLGCGLGRARGPLLQRYAGAEWLGVDLAEPLLRAGRVEADATRRGFARWRATRAESIVADAARLPIADDSVELIFSNLMLNWHPSPHTVFPEWRRALTVNGLLMFSTLGPDTLKELRSAASEALPHAAPMPFVDMHDFGDMMLASGFATPVMDVETLTLTYETPKDLIADVRALGGNPRADRWPALVSTAQAHRLYAALDARRGPDGRIPLTFEVAYGHAWNPPARARPVASIAIETVRSELALRKR
ncbi:MAG: methyltransferase domain-containing protein [Burkholderiaceae bacterium]